MQNFIVVGPYTAIFYKGIWEKIVYGKRGNKTRLYIGYTRRNGNSSRFVTYDDKGNIVEKRVFSIWLTSIETPPPHPIIPTEEYREGKYGRYDNIEAINVDRIKDIPYDYYGPMGLPGTFVLHWNPSQFEILGKEEHPRLNGKRIMKRIIARRVEINVVRDINAVFDR